MKKRIAVHVFEDLILPLQKGEPYSPEREQSNKEIEGVFCNSGYWPGFDLNDLCSGDGYYLTSDFRVEGGNVFFKGSDGKEYRAPKERVIFESENPISFEGWDRAEKELRVVEEE